MGKLSVSGNIKLHDTDAFHAMQSLRNEYARALGNIRNCIKLCRKLLKFIEKKDANDADIKELRLLKGIIRRQEANGGAMYCGLNDK
ncbi:MAG: glucosamine-6-phosphate deaminase, partial [Saprospiraceae bacterium]|nr:glucosamine-6-phosphate deaminase [Saprospiraceae bacterium]